MDFRESSPNELNSYSFGVKMSDHHGRKGIPTKLSVKEFNQFILPHLIVGKRGPGQKLQGKRILNYLPNDGFYVVEGTDLSVLPPS